MAIQRCLAAATTGSSADGVRAASRPLSTWAALSASSAGFVVAKAASFVLTTTLSKLAAAPVAMRPKRPSTVTEL